MPTVIEAPSRIEAAGTKPKVIEEYVGRVNSDTSSLSIAHMRSPAGWEEPAQEPEFDEYTLVLKGVLEVECDGSTYQVRAGQAVVTHRGERVRYSTPKEPTEYIAVCLPAFAPQLVHREE